MTAEGKLDAMDRWNQRTHKKSGLLDRGLKVRSMVLPDTFIDHGDPGRLLASVGLDAEGICKSITAVMPDQIGRDVKSAL